MKETEKFITNIFTSNKNNFCFSLKQKKSLRLLLLTKKHNCAPNEFKCENVSTRWSILYKKNSTPFNSYALTYFHTFLLLLLFGFRLRRSIFKLPQTHSARMFLPFNFLYEFSSISTTNNNNSSHHYVDLSWKWFPTPGFEIKKKDQRKNC